MPLPFLLPGRASRFVISVLHLTEYNAEKWRATFFIAGQTHSIVGSTAWEPTPWGAVQRAAWDALTRPDVEPGR